MSDESSSDVWVSDEREQRLAGSPDAQAEKNRFQPHNAQDFEKLAPKTWKRLRGREINAAQAYETEELDGTFSSTSQVRVAHCFPPGTHNTPTKRKKVAFFSANETRLNANTF